MHLAQGHVQNALTSSAVYEAAVSSTGDADVGLACLNCVTRSAMVMLACMQMPTSKALHVRCVPDMPKEPRLGS